MTPTTTSSRLLLVLGAACGVLLTTTPAADAAATAVPQLSIAVDDLRATATSGDALDYAVLVTNLGSEGVRGVQVTQTRPPGLTFTQAGSGGVIEANRVSWVVDLGAHASTTLRTSATLSQTPAETLRLATTVCGTAAGERAPLVCATDSDQLPAGATEERAASSTEEASTLLWCVVAAGGLLPVGLALALWSRQRTGRRVSRRSRQAGTPGFSAKHGT